MHTLPMVPAYKHNQCIDYVYKQEGSSLNTLSLIDLNFSRLDQLHFNFHRAVDFQICLTG